MDVMGSWMAMLRQRCPRCRRGRIFAGALAMHKQCPECGLLFDREPGYFLGAMYISYPIAAAIMGLFAFLLSLVLPDWDLMWIIPLALVAFLPLAPMVY